jgi:WD40 repeat protein
MSLYGGIDLHSRISWLVILDGALKLVPVSPDDSWIASGDGTGAIRLWRMPDVTKAPLHTLPHDELPRKLMTLTNLRAVPDERSPGGYMIEAGPFPGWRDAPER